MLSHFRAGLTAAVLVAAWASPASAVHVERYQIPYFGLAYEHLGTDSARAGSAGSGVQLTLGVPLKSPRSAVELRFFDADYDSAAGAGDSQSGLLVDYVRDFGVLGQGGDGFLQGIKPFLSAGLGFIREEVASDKHLHLGFGLGGGLMLPLGWNGWAARLDARAVHQSNDESVPGQSSLLDYHLALGLQIPMALFFDKPVTLSPLEDCPVAVVGTGGRRDCATDTDADGVPDAGDECPATASGTAVDGRGCPRRSATDADGDGVANAQDRCPGTQPDLKVDASGCVVAQNTVLRGVTFQPGSARLTPEGRQTLDGVASTLRGQESLKVEIAGHTDAIGSEAYNMLLSQQRAESVRVHLVEQGVADERMNAVGYGELEPVDTNETEEGRLANRRVEFRITTD